MDIAHSYISLIPAKNYVCNTNLTHFSHVRASLVTFLTGWRYDLTDEEAIELGSRAIYHATYRDSYSGGINNLYLVKPDGWKRIHSIDVAELHEKFKGKLAPVPRTIAGGGAASASH